MFQYLGRYTHRVAISNQRIKAVDGGSVRFITRGGDTSTLTPDEFIRRFLLHVLPAGFVKIRHYGLLAPAKVSTALERAFAPIEDSPNPRGFAAQFKRRLRDPSSANFLPLPPPQVRSNPTIRYSLNDHSWPQNGGSNR